MGIAQDEARRDSHRLEEEWYEDIENPETMGMKARDRIISEGLWRTVCDYVAGCTDRYAIEEFKKYGLGDE